MRLYLEDKRTVGVLLQHVQERLTEGYGAFREIVYGMYAGAMRGRVLSEDGLVEVLSEICSEKS